MQVFRTFSRLETRLGGTENEDGDTDKTEVSGRGKIDDEGRLNDQLSLTWPGEDMGNIIAHCSSSSVRHRLSLFPSPQCLDIRSVTSNDLTSLSLSPGLLLFKQTCVPRRCARRDDVVTMLSMSYHSCSLSLSCSSISPLPLPLSMSFCLVWITLIWGHDIADNLHSETKLLPVVPLPLFLTMLSLSIFLPLSYSFFINISKLN